MSAQDEVTFIVESTGDAVYLVTEAAANLNLGSSPLRASHVEPVNPILRLLFHLLRQWLGDKGRMSDFTRSWKCAWRINMKPVGGGILRWKDLPHNACMVKYGDAAWGGNEVAIWYDRLAAIDAEVAALNEHFIRRTL